MKIRAIYKPEAVVSKDPDQFTLRDPYLDVAAKRLVSTDGVRLVALPVEVEPDERNGYVNCELLKIGRKKAKDDLIDVREKEHIEPFGITWPCSQAREFPDWRKTLPSFKEGAPGTVTVAINASLLKGLGDALGSEKVAVTFRLADLNANAEDIVKGAEPHLLVRALNSIARDEQAVLMPIQMDPSTGLERTVPVEEQEDKSVSLDAEADAILERDGKGEMTKKDLTGQAARRVVRRG